MHLFSMKGPWGSWAATLYGAVVARGAGAIYEDFVARVVPEVPDRARIVDVGCGEAQITRLLAARFACCAVLGVDLSPAMIRRARRLSTGFSNLTFELGDAQALPLRDASCDLAVSAASIKHWREPLRGLEELRRVLRPGGALAIAETDRECTVAAARRFARSWRCLPPGTAWLAAAYFRTFVAGQGLACEELTALLREAGFVAIEAQRVAGQPFVVARARRPEA